MVSGARCSNACGSYKGERPKDQNGTVDDAIDPRGDAKVARELGEVVPRPLQVYDDDDPGGRHGKPAKDVRDHAPRKVLPALRLHKVVRLGADDGVGGLDVVERPVERPLVLGDELERARVVAVPLNGCGQRLAPAPEGKLVGAHGPVVWRGVHERLGCRYVFN